MILRPFGIYKKIEMQDNFTTTEDQLVKLKYLLEMGLLAIVILLDIQNLDGKSQS